MILKSYGGLQVSMYVESSLERKWSQFFHTRVFKYDKNWRSYHHLPSKINFIRLISYMMGNHVKKAYIYH